VGSGRGWSGSDGGLFAAVSLFPCMRGSAHEEIVLGVLEDQVDCFVFQDDLSQRTQISMMQLSIQLIGQHMRRRGVSQRAANSALARTMISRAPDWLIPAYVCTSPSLSGLNFLIANTSPSFATLSPGRMHSSGLFSGSPAVVLDKASLSLGRSSAERVCVGSVDGLALAGGGRRRALYTRPYVPAVS